MSSVNPFVDFNSCAQRRISDATLFREQATFLLAAAPADSTCSFAETTRRTIHALGLHLQTIPDYNPDTDDAQHPLSPTLSEQLVIRYR